MFSVQVDRSIMKFSFELQFLPVKISILLMEQYGTRERRDGAPYHPLIHFVTTLSTSLQPFSNQQCLRECLDFLASEILVLGF